MISYAQNFEDVMLRRALQDVERGFYIDIGGFDPEVDSVTRWFYDSGWRGINAEPHPDLLAKFAADRPNDINLEIAVADRSGQRTFHRLDGTGLSSLETSSAEPDAVPPGSRAIEIRALSLPDLIETYCPGQTIDFLKIDAEGAEEEILRGADLERHRPRIILVEATQPLSQEPAWAEWEPLIVGRGYELAWFDGLNRFYVRHEDLWRRRFFDLPPCCFDNFQTPREGHLTGRLEGLLEQLEASSRAYFALQKELSGRIDDLTNAHGHMDASISHLNGAVRMYVEQEAHLNGRLDELGQHAAGLESRLTSSLGTLAESQSQAVGLATLSSRLHRATEKGPLVILAPKRRRRLIGDVKELDARVATLIERLGRTAP